MTTKRARSKAIEEELEVLDAMVVSLVELLEIKGITTQEEWDSRVRARLVEEGKLGRVRSPRRGD